MAGSFALFIFLGAIATAIAFAIIYAIKDVQDHEMAALCGVVAGALILLTPARPLILETAGTLAQSVFSWILMAALAIAWLIGTGVAYFLLEKYFP